jgi:hypothetical protein
MGVKRLCRPCPHLSDSVHLMYKYYESTNFKVCKGFLDSIVECEFE